MAKFSIKPAAIPLCFFLVASFLLLTQSVWAQRRPEIIEPKARTDGNAVRSVRSAPATKGVLYVLFDYEVEGKVRIETLAGKLVEEVTTDATGQAQFVLKRGQAYKVKGSAQGYQGDERNSKILKATDTVLLRLTAKTATLSLVDLPAGAQIYLDEQPKPRAVINQTGSITISDLVPGIHKLRIKHPEYRDFVGDLPDLKAGATMIYPVTLDKVATLTFQAIPGAQVLIDGAVRGTVQNDGKVTIDYVIEQVADHSITVELLGYQTWSQKGIIAPGPRTIAVKLDPIVTSTGVSDFFDSLSQWNAPPTWELIGDARNKKLRVKGAALGILKDRTYRDIQEGSNFTVWLEDGKGVTWAVRADRDGRNYYLFHLAGPKSTTHTPKRFYTYLVKDGGTPIEVSTPIPVQTDLNQKASYTINVEVVGYTIKHWITSNETGQRDDLGIWTDTTTTKDKFLYGAFGFRSLSGEVFTVDDFNLEPTKPQ